MFIEVGKVLEPAAMGSPPSGEDIAKLIEAAPKYGIELLLPEH